jgi:hypothetical protein
MANIRVYKADRFSYAIENKAFPMGRSLNTIDEVRAYARAIVESPWWTARCAQSAVAVLSTKSRTMSYSEASKGAIYLSGYHWNEGIVLHELCHQLTDSRHGYSRHNEKFMYWLFRMHKQFNSCFDFPEKWEEADRLYLEAGVSVGMDDPNIEAENRGRTKPVPPEAGPVYQGQAPKGYIRMRSVSAKVLFRGKSMSNFVNACGGDKCDKEPRAEYWRVVYAAGVKWLPVECLEHLDELADARRGR